MGKVFESLCAMFESMSFSHSAEEGVAYRDYRANGELAANDSYRILSAGSGCVIWHYTGEPCYWCFNVYIGAVPDRLTFLSLLRALATASYTSYMDQLSNEEGALKEATH